MLKRDVKIGGRYVAKVAGVLTVVKITGEATSGWAAINERSGRSIRIKSAQRLRSEVEPGESVSMALVRERLASMERNKA